MANRKITELTALTGANATDTDVFAIVDVSADETKKMTLGELKEAFDSGSGFVRITGDTMTGDLSFGDNDKAIFGAGSDLQIYHDGNDSYISEVNSGGGNNLHIQGANILLEDPDGNQFIKLTDNGTGGSVTLKHNAATVLATTSTGIDVTGTVTADGLTVDGTSAIRSGNQLQFFRADNGVAVDIYNGGSNVGLVLDDNNGDGFRFKYNSQTKMSIDPAGDISFYEDTGTTAKFFWDASAESLGIGTSSPEDKLSLDQPYVASGEMAISFNQSNFANRATKIIHKMDASGNGGSLLFATNANGADASERMRIDSSGLIKAVSSITSDPTDTGAYWYNKSGVGPTLSGYRFSIRTGGTPSEALRVDESGNVGIGTSSPARTLHLNGSDSDTVQLHITNATTGSTSNDGFSIALGSDESGILNMREANPIRFFTADTERMRITSSGNVGIGTSSPFAPLTVKNNPSFGIYSSFGSYSDNYPQLMFGNNASTAATAHIVASTLIFNNSTSSETMRIDSSGNLLVGLSSAEAVGTNAGTQLRADGLVYAAATSDAHILSRRSTDGSILNFRKDTTTVGSIGTTTNSYLWAGGTNSGIFFYNNGFGPSVGSSGNGALTNGTKDIGASGNRFKDLYLSGGVYLGGTGSANKLDDYEEGTWTPSIISGGFNSTMTVNTANYTKIGRLVHVQMDCQFTGTGTSAQLQVGGLPYTNLTSGYSSGTCYMQNMNTDFIHGPVTLVDSNSTRIVFQVNDSTSVIGSTMSGNDIDAGYMQLSVTYQVAT